MSSPEAGSSSSDEEEFNAQTGATSTEPKEEGSSSAQTDGATKASGVAEPSESTKGGESKGASDDDEDDAKGSEGPSKDNEMADLFGSDYDSEEEEFKASGVKESPVPEDMRAATELYADETTDHVGGHSSEMWLPKTPKANKGAAYYVCKMPNILRLVPEAYTKQSIQEETRNQSDESIYRNYVRWRYQRDEDGHVKLDPETQKPLRESNTKVVQWEDGTLTMFVGKEALNMSRQPLANSFLYAQEVASDRPDVDDSQAVRETVLESHSQLDHKFTIRPMTTSSKSHKRLTMSMRAQHNKGVQKVKEYISEMDGDREQAQRAKINDDRLRLQNRKKAKQTYEYDRDRSSRMDASFLEEGIEYEEGESVAAIKEQFGGRSGRKAPKKHAKEPLGGGFDDYSRRREVESESEDESEQEEEEEEEEMVFRSNKKRRTVED